MHAAENQEFPQSCNDRYTEEASGGTEPGQTVADGIAHNSAQRCQQAEDKRNGDQHTEERSEYGGQHIRHDLFDELIHHAEEENRQHDGQHCLGIVGNGAGDTKHCEWFPGRSISRKIRYHENTADETAQHGGDAQLLGGVETCQNGHEVEGGVIQEVKQDVQVAFRRIQSQQFRPAQGVDAAEQRARQQHGNQWGHAARHVAHDVLAHLFGGQFGLGHRGVFRRGFGVLHRRIGSEVRQLAQFLVDLGHIGADDDLVLLAAAHHAQHTADSLDFLILRDGVVLQVEP